MMLGCLPVLFGIFIYKKFSFFEVLFSGVDIFDLFSRQNLFVRNYLAPSCHYSHEFFLNSHWLGFIVH